jgi:putative MATE family efflux protein
VLVNVVNTVLSAGLLLGFGLFPSLGWEALAIGTACGHGLAGTIILILLLRGRAGLKLERRELRPDVPLMRRILRVGMPGGLDMLAMISCHLIYVSIINRLGTVPAAAHGLALRIEALAYLPGSAFHVAAATMTGQYLGAGDPRRAARSALLALAMGGGFQCFMGGLLFFGGPLVASFFFPGDETKNVVALASRLLPIVSLGMPFFAILTVFSGALRGAGDTRWPLIITFVGLIGVRIPLAAYLAWDYIPVAWLEMTLPGCGLGAVGAWYAMLLDAALRSALISYRFFSGRWQHVRV